MYINVSMFNLYISAEEAVSVDYYNVNIAYSNIYIY